MSGDPSQEDEEYIFAKISYVGFVDQLGLEGVVIFCWSKCMSTKVAQFCEQIFTLRAKRAKLSFAIIVLLTL
jgi:hypothetical protein